MTLLHLTTISFPVADPDEPSLIDFALHGYSSLYHNLLPNQLQHFSNFFVHELFDGHLSMVRVAISVFGFGLAQARLTGLVFSLVGLWMFFYLLYRHARTRGVEWAALAFGLTEFFFFTSHNVRPEGSIFAAQLMNMSLLFSVPAGLRARCLHGIAGFIAAWSLTFHPAAIFYVSVMPIFILLRDRPKGWKQPSLWYWLLGASMGTSVLIPMVIDMDSVMQSWSIAVGLWKRAGPPVPLTFQWQWNRYIEYLLTFLWKWQFPPSVITLVTSSVILLSVSIAARRWATLATAERWFVRIPVAGLIMFVLLSGSATKSYLLQPLPWLFAVHVLVVLKVWRREWRLDLVDKLSGFMVVWAMGHTGAEVSLQITTPVPVLMYLSTLAVLVQWARSDSSFSARKRQTCWMASGVVAVLCLFLYPGYVIIVFHRLFEGPLAITFVAAATLLTGGVWLATQAVLHACRTDLRVSRLNALLLMMPLVLELLRGSVVFSREARHWSTTLRSKRVLTEFRHEPGLIAPNLWWVYLPPLTEMQDSNALDVYGYLGIEHCTPVASLNTDPLRRLASFHPQTVWWPDRHVVPAKLFALWGLHPTGRQLTVARQRANEWKATPRRLPDARSEGRIGLH